MAAMLPKIKADTIDPVIIIRAAIIVYNVFYGASSFPVIVNIE